MALQRPARNTDGPVKTEHSSRVRAQSASEPVRDSFRPQPAASPRILRPAVPTPRPPTHAFGTT
eukprot:751160-Heterocapsa_arctica.AAC.1